MKMEFNPILTKQLDAFFIFSSKNGYGKEVGEK